MNKIVCIFAHPDDEAFGPGGTIALLAQTHEVYLICVTNGDDSRLSASESIKLGRIRRKELRRSSSVLGVQRVFFLDFQDGKLCNLHYHEIAGKIRILLEKLKPDTLLTFEPRGVSGHIDHIAVSMITTYVYEKLSFVKKLMYYCISEQNRSLYGEYFIYFPPGYNLCEIDEKFDISSTWSTKIAAMFEHTSQLSDAERIAKYLEKLPQEEYFLVREK